MLLKNAHHPTSGGWLTLGFNYYTLNKRDQNPKLWNSKDVNYEGTNGKLKVEKFTTTKLVDQYCFFTCLYTN